MQKKANLKNEGNGIISLPCFLSVKDERVGFMFVLPLYLGYLVLVKKTITPGDFVASFNSAYSIAISINFPNSFKKNKKQPLLNR